MMVFLLVSNINSGLLFFQAIQFRPPTHLPSYVCGKDPQRYTYVMEPPAKTDSIKKKANESFRKKNFFHPFKCLVYKF